MKGIDAYLDAECETGQLDFKAGFDPTSNQEWCELLKDIVAMANSGGGCIIIGRNDDGSASGCDVEPLLELDPADLSNKVEKYTGCLYADFRIIERGGAGKRVGCLALGRVCVPMVFTKPGTYAVSGTSQQKTAFSQGTVYFRHGAKSEPGTADDLRAFVEREVSRVRNEWLDNVRKVVEAPLGTQVMVVSPDANLATAPAHGFRLTANPEAPLVRELDPNRTHPHRQTEVVRLVGEKLGQATSVTAHDVFAARNVHGIGECAEFCYKPKHSSPQYSDLFVDWLVDEYRKNSNFFVDAKHQLQKDAGIKRMSADGDSRLRWLDAYMRERGISNTTLGRKLGYSSTTVSLFLRGLYGGDVNKVLEQIEKLMETEGASTS